MKSTRAAPRVWAGLGGGKLVAPRQPYFLFSSPLRTFGSSPSEEDAASAEMQRHKPPVPLLRPRDVVVACVPLKSNVNVSAIARTCSCLGVRQLLCCGTAKLLHKVAREATLRQGDDLKEKKEREDGEPTDKSEVPWFRVVNTLRHPLLRLKEEGYEVVGLEQTAESTSLYDFKFVRKTVIVIGSENRGIPPDVLAVCDRVVEIPLNGPPHSLNVASAAAIGLFEYCKQHP